MNTRGSRFLASHSFPFPLLSLGFPIAPLRFAPRFLPACASTAVQDCLMMVHNCPTAGSWVHQAPPAGVCGYTTMISEAMQGWARTELEREITWECRGQ